MVRVHFREPLCRGPRIDYRRNIYDRLYVIYRRSQKLRFRISKVDKLSSIFYRLLSKFLSLFFTDAGENRIYFCEQVYASRDNMSGSSSCERNRAFYEVRTKHDIIYAKARLETSGLAESRPPSSRFFSPSLRIARYTTTQFSFVSEIRRGENGGDGR